MRTPEDRSELYGDLGREFRQIAGRSVLFDGEGFLWEPSDWSETVAEALASEAGLESLGEAHWRAIGFLREYYKYNGRAPLNKQFVAGSGLSLRELEQLFPGGIKYGARRIAGLPNPKTCT